MGSQGCHRSGNGQERWGKGKVREFNFESGKIGILIPLKTARNIWGHCDHKNTLKKENLLKIYQSYLTSGKDSCKFIAESESCICI